MSKFYVIATPIGNLQDITLRAIETLKSVDLILCEDTRQTKKILEKYNINTPTMSYPSDDVAGKNSRQNSKLAKIFELLEGGKNLALVSDAGTPTISDPGAMLVSEIKAKFNKAESLHPSSKGFREKFNFLTNDVLNYFKDVLFKNYGLKNIRRVGIIFSHKINRDKGLDEAVKVLTKTKIDSVDNINISFSKKLPATEALYRKDVNDYKNTIYNLTEMEGAVLAELDYQYLRECFVDKVLTDSKAFLKSNFHDWLKDVETKNEKVR